MTPRQTFFTTATRPVALAAAAAAWALMPVVASAGQATRQSGYPQMRRAHAHRSSQPSPLRNGALWATVDVCRAKPRALIGIRGSMPSDGRAQDMMYMRFRIEYLDVATKRWAGLASGGESSFVKVGPADATRQAGRTFDLTLPTHGASYRMRGTVEFQWRRGSRVSLSATRATSGGRHVTAGAVPRGYSAATCTIGG